MSKINIIDSIMGSGKTSYFIQKMNDDKDNKYIYITPYLDEVSRIKTQCTNKKFYEPLNRGKGKLDSLHSLLLKGNNIASTHSLFKLSNNITSNLIKAHDYILILDEVMDVVEQIPLKKNDLQILLDQNLITIGDNGIVIWNEDKLDFESKYDDIKRMCLNKNLFLVNNTLILWTFPTEIFKAFKEVYVLSYLFHGQIQRYYYDFFNLEYQYYSIGKKENTYELIEYIPHEIENMKYIQDLITIIDNPKLNIIGEDVYSLSKTWFSKEDNKILLNQLKNNLNNFFRNVLKSKSNENLWTTFKDYKNILSGKGYTKGFISCNTRATNTYSNTCNIAYCCNIFLNPYVKRFFKDREIEVNEDLFALSELIQWIWRSRIRKNKPITLYIPSTRMRELFINWLYNN